MTLFESVKASVTAREAAEYYGIRVNRNGMACCPFHPDKNPSMKLDRRFHCFGCQEDGDVIDFTAKLFNLGLQDAAKKLAEDFSITYDHYTPAVYMRSRTKSVLNKRHLQRKEEKRYWNVYCEYLHLLRDWGRQLSPGPDDIEWDPLYVEAMQKTEITNNILDTLWDGTPEEKAQIIHDRRKEVAELEERIKDFSKKSGRRCSRDSSDGIDGPAGNRSRVA